MEDIGNQLSEFLDDFRALFETVLFNLGESEITLGRLIIVVLSIVFLFLLAGRFTKALSRTILQRYNTSESTIHTVATITRYIILVIGLMIIIQSAGLDLSSLSILAGALGVGIGFGLQNITNNFISGIIILFEQPIKIGDRIEVGHIKGDVVKISARSTTVVTNDNISVIVPNSDFISTTVINWSHNDRSVSFRYPVGVSYKSDPKIVKKILLDVAEENNGVLKNPSPQVLFDSFGDSSLNFHLRVWTSDYTARPNILKSQLYYAIFKKFGEAGVEIPFPQRDLHVRSGLDFMNKNDLTADEE